MGTSLAVILTNLWLEGYEPVLTKEVPKLTALKKITRKSALDVRKR